MTVAARHLVPIGEIVAGLAGDIEALCQKLLPAGRRERDEWVVAGKDSPFGCSLSVHLRVPKQGVWSAWAAGNGGDALDLVARVACNGDKRAAVKWALAWLGMSGESPHPCPPPLAGEGEQRARDQAAAAAELARRSNAAKRIWLGAAPSLKGTPAERYLRRRGIDLALLGRQPAALRFHPALYEAVTGRHWPALVGLINTPLGLCAVHRIWLTPEGDKAPIPKGPDGGGRVKRAYGPKRGGWIALWRGCGNKPLREAEAGSAVWLSEGIEDGLAIALLTGGQDRVLAAIDLGNMALIQLPPQIATIVIAGQNDKWWADGQERAHGAARGLDKAIRHFQAQGREVRLWRSDKPGCKDANDHLLAQNSWAFREHRMLAKVIRDEAMQGGDAA